MADQPPKVTALESRDGLPDALRALVEEYPRSGWTTDPGFNGLIQFWLERHMMFRKILARLSQESRAVIDRSADPHSSARAVSQLGGMLVNQLHGHHQIEDAQYFPVLSQRDASLVRGFEILDADHHALDGHLATFVEGANAALNAAGDDRAFRENTAQFQSTVQTFEGFLERHLIDEEELVVPTILKYGMDGLH